MEICYNPCCKDLKSKRSRKGWKLRNGDFAELCDRCASVFEEGRFCEMFHSDAAGWRTCESCRKRIHCGCIVSIHTYVFLDLGGVHCMACARKNIIMPPNQLPSSPSLPLLPSGTLKDLSVNQIGGISTVSELWHQPFHSQNLASIQSELRPRMRYEVGGIKIISGECSATSVDRKLEVPSDKIASGSLNFTAIQKFVEGNTGLSMVTALQGLHRQERTLDGLQSPYLRVGENGPFCTRKAELAEPGYTEPQTKPIVSNLLRPSFPKDDRPNLPLGTVMQYSTPNGANCLTSISGAQSEQRTSRLPCTKLSNPSIHKERDPSSETQVPNGRNQVDARGRNQLLPRYSPRITDQELQQISGDSNSVITPLFEKMLSASDAGRIGRLVLPKKCAEAYLPTISHPEGLPLKVQDLKGQEWVFQFRFWPNNNSRMYVLEGVTPCIQSMQLQAGDIVTFSRLDPGGKLVMGCRKASSVQQSDQDNQSQRTSNGVYKNAEVNPADAASTLSKDKSSYIAKEEFGDKSLAHPSKRKNRTLGSKSKRLRIEKEDLIELKLTWEEAQRLLCPPPNHNPSVVVIDGVEFEEYEEPPIFGKPTNFTTDCKGSSCSSAQDITTEQLEGPLSSYKTGSASKKMKASKKEILVEASEGLNALVNLAMLEKDDVLPPSAQPTTRHPRHRPGCTCIVCIQPPSGKGPKHKDTCTCNLCSTVKRRFHTLMQRREKRQSEKDAETARKKLEMLQLPDNPEQGDDVLLTSNAGNNDQPVASNTGEGNAHPNMLVNESADDHYPNEKKPSNSPCKGRIDLNIQPEREDELSPERDNCSMTSNAGLAVNQLEPGEDWDVIGRGNGSDAGGRVVNGLSTDPLLDAGMERPTTQCESRSAATETN